MIFLDANLFLRALTRSDQPDVQSTSRAAADLFRRADLGEVELITSDAVIAEVAFVLTARARYALAADDAAARIATLLRLRGVRLRDKRIILRALDIWAEHPGLGFVDALTAAYARQPGMRLASFDSDFDQVSGIDRWSPEDPAPDSR